MKSASRGFTLVELMVSVAIIGILASVAIPNFTRYILKAKDSEAYMLLPELAQSLQMLYEREICSQGVTGTFGTATQCATHCLTVWGNSPGPAIGPLNGSTYVPDWNKAVGDIAGFEWVDFRPSDPLYHRFGILSSVVDPLNGPLADACGNENGESYIISSVSDLDDDDLAGIRTMSLQTINGQLVRNPGVNNWNMMVDGVEEW